MSQLNVVILAAGKGTRMRSDLPKVLHPVAKKPMVGHVIECAQEIGADAIQIIYGHEPEKLKLALSHYLLTWHYQEEQLGTGHAVDHASPQIKDTDTVLILYGDVPLTRPETLKALLEAKKDTDLALLTVHLSNPQGYGRIVREGGSEHQPGRITGIVEQKDASPEQLLIQEANTGIMAVTGSKLKQWLAQVDNNNVQQEYYLTDIVGMAAQEGVAIGYVMATDEMEVAGANNRVQLAALERAYQTRQAEELMIKGATLLDPARVDVRGQVEIDNDVVIDVNVIFEGKVVLGKNVQIDSNCVIKNAVIHDGAHIKANSVIEDAVIGEGAQVGPFARIRPGSELKAGAAIGNFVEIKNTVMHEGAKAGHLSYLGDSEVGAAANIGAGTITCNYDGANKFKTIIGEHAFIGSNSSLVAPLTIGNYGTTGAGSTVTQDVSDHQLAVARSKQRNIDGWKRPSKNK